MAPVALPGQVAERRLDRRAQGRRRPGRGAPGRGLGGDRGRAQRRDRRRGLPAGAARDGDLAAARPRRRAGCRREAPERPRRARRAQRVARPLARGERRRGPERLPRARRARRAADLLGRRRGRRRGDRRARPPASSRRPTGSGSPSAPARSTSPSSASSRRPPRRLRAPRRASGATPFSPRRPRAPRRRARSRAARLGLRLGAAVLRAAPFSRAALALAAPAALAADLGKLRSSSRATAEGLRAVRIRAPRRTSSPSGVWATRGGEQGDREAAVLVAGGVDEPAGVAAVGAPGGVDEQAEQALGLGPALRPRTPRAGRGCSSARRQTQACAWSRRPIRRSASASSRTLVAGAALVARPGADRVDRVVEGVRRRAARRSRPSAFSRSCVVAVALHAGEQEAAAQLLGLVVLEHRLRARASRRG